MTDEEIIEMLFARTEESISAIDAKYGRKCRRMSADIVGNEQDAEECVNDTYLVVWNSVPPERPNSFFAYLCKIVRNLSLKKYRANNVQKRSCVFEELVSELEPFLSAENTVENDMEKKELAEMIEGFLDTLSPENRIIFMRRYWFSESYAEVAKNTGISEKAVSVRLTRIREKMKNYLLERGVTV